MSDKGTCENLWEYIILPNTCAMMLLVTVAGIGAEFAELPPYPPSLYHFCSKSAPPGSQATSLMKLIGLTLAALVALGTVAVSPLLAQTAPPNALNFQGRIATSSGNPVADGAYSVRFRLYNAATGGATLADQIIANVQVKNGVFAVQLNVTPIIFNGNTWLGISINGAAELAPRQQIVSVPYAMKSNLALTVPDGSITNAKIAAGTLTADRFTSGVFNATAWLLNGNSGVTSGFVGTTDNQPLEFRVKDRRAMRYQYAENTATGGFEYRSINVLGGSELNSIGAGVAGATIAGGGEDYFTRTDHPNSVTADFATIGGGAGNTASGIVSTIAGGGDNTASGEYSSIGGGQHNTASGRRASVGGGVDNTASGWHATVAGGSSNIASGSYSTVAGGFINTAAGSYSFAAGLGAIANHTGAFVWADNDIFDFASTAPNQFCIRASGGFVFEAGASPVLYTASTSGEANRYLQLINSPQTSNASGLKAGGILCADAYAYSNPGKNDMTIKGRAAIGFDVNTTTQKLAVNGNLYCIGFANASDARWKQNVTVLPNALESVLALRGVAYEWKPTDGMDFPGGKHIGFIAQEVEKVLPELVTTDKNGYKSVAYQNVVPVLVEAVKTLKKDNDTKAKRLAELEARLDRLEAALKANK